MNKFLYSDYPKTNPIFIAADQKSFDLIRRLNGFCFLATNLVNDQEFGFCYQREI